MKLSEYLKAQIRFAKKRVRVLMRPGYRLPPGELDPRENRMYRDPLFYIERFARYGPVFKVSWGQHILVCISGNGEARKFITENQDRLRGISLKLNKIFPKGYLRNMVGEEHRHYRRILTSALHNELVPTHDGEFRELVRRELLVHARACADGAPSRAGLLRQLNLIATQMLVRLVYGVPPQDPAFDTLCALHDRFGPEDLVWKADNAQKAIYDEIRGMLAPQVERIRSDQAGSGQHSCLGGIIAAGEPDETVFGNLIYTVEMGRYDLYGLLHWVVKYVSESPEAINDLRNGLHNGGNGGPSLSQAVVMETLRLDQGEGVARTATSNITQNGYFYPRGTMFRACLWDNHKDESTFPEPFRFNPYRFLDNTFTIEQYAPFGLDNHRCIAADLCIQLGALFVEELANGFEWNVLEDGPRTRGAFHWEPNERFSIDLRERAGSSSSDT